MSGTSWRRAAMAALGAAVTVSGAVMPAGTAHAAVTTAPGVPVTRYAGTNRYDTAAQVATGTFTTADNVVIASGASFADALSGNYLAGNLGAPILLTDPTTLSGETATALGTLKTRSVDVLGGPGAVSDAVVSAIAAMTSTNAAGGKITVTRIFGASRYDTDKAVVETPPAAYVATIGGKKTAMLASGLGFPDALAGGALAFGAALPILLTDPATLSPQAAAAIHDLGITQVLILGGPAAVSTSVENAVTALGVTTVRLAGTTRTGTAAAVATYAGLTLGWGSAPQQVPTGFPADAVFTHINVARGDDAGGGVDALALGPHAGKGKAPIMLTASVDDPSADIYYEVYESTFDAPTAQGPLAGIGVAGGTGAVSAANAQLINVATGGGSIGQMTVTPAAATGGTTLTATSVDPCPAAPAGSAAFVSVFLLPVGGVKRSDVVSGPIALTGGPFSMQGQVAIGLSPGQYQSVASCGVTFPGDPIFYPYAGDLGPMITVT